MIYECGTRFHFRILKNLGSDAQLIVQNRHWLCS